MRDGSEHSGKNRPEFGQALLACSMAAVFRTRAKKFLIEAGRNLNTVVLIFNPYQTPEGPVFCLWGPPILSTCKHWNGFWAQYSPYSKEKGRQRASTTLADLFTLLFAANPFSAAWASLWRWSSDEFEDGLAHGGQCRSRRRPVDSFFSRLAVLSRRYWRKA